MEAFRSSVHQVASKERNKPRYFLPSCMSRYQGRRFPPIVKLSCGWIRSCHHHITYCSLSTPDIHYHFSSITSIKNIALDLITMPNLFSRHNSIFLFRKVSWYSHILFGTLHKISHYFTRMSWSLFITIWNSRCLKPLKGIILHRSNISS